MKTYSKSPASNVLQTLEKPQPKKVDPVFLDNRASTNIQLKQQKTIMNGYSGNKIIQRVEKWWPTNADHTAITGGESATAPAEGAFVKREKAGASDELFSTEAEAWTKAKAVSLSNRPDNTELFPGTVEKAAVPDGNRTYLTKAESKKDVSIVVTHTTDPQSVLAAEDGTKLKVRHTHSAFAKHPAVKKAVKDNTALVYSNSDEAKVHYLSLTPQ